jgi:hypothetical protein
MRNLSKFLIVTALSTLPVAFAQAEMQVEPKEGDVLVCATPADAMTYAASHKDALQASIAGGADDKACVATKVVFIPGKQGDRIEHRDATYAVTEILIVAVNTPRGILRTRPSIAFALLRLNETPV